MTDMLQRLLDKEQIRDVMLRYARGVDRRDWELVRSAFYADCVDEHADFKGKRDEFIAWVRQRHDVDDFRKSAHLLANCLIEFADDGVAAVETYFVARLELGAAASEHRAMLDQGRSSGGGRMRVQVQGRYVDRFEKRDGEWRIARRRTVFDTLQSQTLEEGEGELNPSWLLGTRDRSDPLNAARAEAGLQADPGRNDALR
jgi:hypothetical protein